MKLMNDLFNFEEKDVLTFYTDDNEYKIEVAKITDNDNYELHMNNNRKGTFLVSDELFDKIVKSDPDIVLVALGIPLQEKLIYKHLNKFDKGIFVGVGGSFDVISGHKKRAPMCSLYMTLR